LQGQKLVTEIDKGGVLALASQFELKQPAVEGQRLFDVTDPADRAGRAGAGPAIGSVEGVRAH
jgi:hypothetical protein